MAAAAPLVGLLGPSVVPGAMVGAKAGMLLSGKPGYQDYIRGLQGDYRDAAINTAQLYLPETPDASSIINNLITTENYTSKYISGDFNQIIEKAFNSMVQSNPVYNNPAQPQYETVAAVPGMDEASAMAATAKDLGMNIDDFSAKFKGGRTKQEQIDYEAKTTSYLATQKKVADLKAQYDLDLKNLKTHQSAYMNTIKMIGSMSDLSNEVKQSMNAAAVAEYKKQQDLVEQGTGKTYRDFLNSEEFKANAFDPTKANTTRNSKWKAWALNVRPIFNKYLNGTQETKKLIRNALTPEQQASVELADKINSITSSQQKIIEQQQLAAETEKQNIQTAIFNQITRSRQRRGY